MKIALGTTNKLKIEATQRAIDTYEFWQGAELLPIKVSSDVPDQPIGLDQIITGAKNRARKSYEEAQAAFGVGLEAGIFPVPHTKSDYLDTSACAIFDGKNYYIGLSSCFEYPKKMIEKILTEGKEVRVVADELHIIPDMATHEQKGMLGILSHDKITRTDYIYQSLQAALVHLQNPEHY